MSLFDAFRKKENKTENNGMNRSDPPGYYFQNAAEFATYCQLFANGREIVWLSGDNYAKEYIKGYDLFEQKRYKKAIDVFKNALVLNPIGISARFEICEAYMRLNDWEAAKKTLLDMKDFLVDDQSIAKFYRRFGFLSTELRDYEVASACFLYSGAFEKHPSIIQELAYIKSQGGTIVSPNDVQRTIKKASIPVFAVPSAEKK